MLLLPEAVGSRRGVVTAVDEEKEEEEDHRRPRECFFSRPGEVWELMKVSKEMPPRSEEAEVEEEEEAHTQLLLLVQRTQQALQGVSCPHCLLEEFVLGATPQRS